MKGFIWCLGFFCLHNVAIATDNPNQQTPLFRENKGQLVDQHQNLRKDILFYGSTEGLSYFLKKDGISYQLYKTHISKQANTLDRNELPENDSITIQRIDVTWIGANKSVKLIHKDEAKSYDNFYLPQCPNGLTGVKNYEEIIYKDIYPNIDLRYYQKEGNLKYDYIVKPGGDPNNIRLKIEGADRITQNEDGSLTVETPMGNIVEGVPEVFQEGKTIKADWIKCGNELSFDINHYDRTKDFVIDPLVSQWGSTNGSASYYGVTYGGDATVDVYGNIFWIGHESPPDQSFLIKYNSSQVQQFKFNYFGGSSGGFSAMASDNNGDIYLVGSTNVSGVATSGSFQTTIAGDKDGIVIKLNNNGVKTWATYYGGSGFDNFRRCDVDQNGNLYGSGTTYSLNSISSSGGYQPIFGGGQNDGFLVKFNPSGARIWGTYYGGSGDESANGCSYDSKGFLYICGSTSSSSGIATTGMYQTSLLGASNGFLAKFDTNGARQWATYYGADTTSASDCSADTSGNVYFCGNTTSVTNIATIGVSQTIYGGLWDGYLTRFDASGNRIWGTYLGGSSYEDARGLGVNNLGKVYVAGSTTSPNNIATTGVQNNLGYGSGFLNEFDTTGQKLWGVYIMGSSIPGAPWATAINCCADSSGNVYLLGGARSTSSGSGYAFIGKYIPYTVPTPVMIVSPSNIFCGGNYVQLSTAAINGATYQWYLNGNPIGVSSPTISVSSGGIYTVSITNNSSTATSAPITLIQNPSPFNTVTQTNVLCNGDATGSISLNTSSGTPPFSYFWKGLPSVTTPFLNNLKAGTYVITTVDINGCSRKDSIILTENDASIVFSNKTDASCSGAATGSVILNLIGGLPPFTYSWSNLPDTTPSVYNLAAGVYVATIKDKNGCPRTETFNIINDNKPLPSQPLASVCAVTVDSSTGRNLVIWEKNGIRHASVYKIYRESSVAGQYDLIGSKLSNQFSTFLDTNANPMQRSYQYKISEMDSCGNEFSLSDHHKTIHLTSNRGINNEVNLSWNQYEGKSYGSHYIMRSVGNGPFVNLSQVSASITSFTDLTPPFGIKRYRIDIDLPTLCNPTAKTTAYARISSNRVALDTLSAPKDIRIVPNPATDRVQVFGQKPELIKVMDVVGRVVLEISDTDNFSLGHVSKGIYLVCLYDEEGKIYYYEKLLKQ